MPTTHMLVHRPRQQSRRPQQHMVAAHTVVTNLSLVVFFVFYT